MTLACSQFLLHARVHALIVVKLPLVREQISHPRKQAHLFALFFVVTLLAFDPAGLHRAPTLAVDRPARSLTPQTAACQTAQVLRVVHFLRFTIAVASRGAVSELLELVYLQVCLVAVCVLDEKLEDLHTLRLFTYFYKWSDVKTLLMKLDNIIRPVHIDKDFFITELMVFVAHDVVYKWFFRPTEVAPKD